MISNSVRLEKTVLALALAFVFALLGLAPELAFGALSCGGVFSTPDRAALFGEVNPGFKHEQKFDVEVKAQSSVKDQCQLGTCHTHAWISQMEHDYQVRTGKPIKLSTDYLAAYQWGRQALMELNKNSKKVSIELGAYPIDSRALILEAGVIPEGVWKPLVDFTSAPISNRIQASLKNIIARAKIARRTAKTPEETLAINSAAHKEIVEIFNNFEGEFPVSFVHEGATYNAQSFLKERFPDLGGYIVTLNVQANPKLKVGVTANLSQMAIAGNINLVEKTARELIDKGENVYLSYDHVSEFVDNASGVMSMKAFLMPSSAYPLPRQQRQEAGLSGGGHAVQIVGYSLDLKTGRVAKWKIKNSWGTQSGYDGYYTMYRDYFRNYVRGLTYFAKSVPRIPKFEKRDSFDPGI